jgi:hypothetical protein
MPADRWPATCDQSNSLRIEADQGRPAKPRSGSQQEQRAIAQSGKIARAGGGHPCEQTPGRLRPAPGDGRAAHRTQEGLPGRIDGGSSEPVLAMLVGDGGEAPHQRAIAHRLGQTGQIGRDRVGVGRQWRSRRRRAPPHEGRPIARIEPHRLSGRRPPGCSIRVGRQCAGRYHRLRGRVAVLRHRLSPLTHTLAGAKPKRFCRLALIKASLTKAR